MPIKYGPFNLSRALPTCIALISVFLLSGALYISTFNDFFTQDDFVGLSLGRSVSERPASLLNPSPDDFPPGYRTGQVAWWALGWKLGHGRPTVFRIGQVIILGFILFGIFAISLQLGTSTRGAIFGMWFFLLMPLLTESIYWLAATPLHLVFSLLGLILFITWLRRENGHTLMALSLAFAFLSCITKEAGVWSFIAIIAAGLLLPGARSKRSRLLASCLALAGLCLYITVYWLLPYSYPSNTRGVLSIIDSYSRLLFLGWLELPLAIRKAAAELGMPSALGWTLSRATALALLAALLMSAYLVIRLNKWNDKVRCLVFTVVTGMMTVLPYSLSAVRGGRYLVDIDVFVALCWVQLSDPFISKRRVIWPLIITCMMFSIINVLATRSIRTTYDMLGQASYKLVEDIRSNATQTDRYLLLGFPERGGYLRVWHLPKMIHLYDTSVDEIDVIENKPESIAANTAVIAYSESSMPGRYHQWFSTASALP